MRALVALVLTVALAGCGFGAGESKKGGVELRVTRDFGERDLHADSARKSVRESDTVMRFLQAGRKVATRFGGGFVQSIDGLAGDQSAEHDWFYYVNGSEASVGAADYKLHPGDVVQWDYHDWHATQHVPAIVGAFPQPFAHGLTGKRLPTRLECEDDRSKACETAGNRLAQYGVNATSAAIGSPVSDKSLRVIVAKFSGAKDVLAASALTQGPASTGVYAKFDSAGTTLSLLDGAGHAARVAPPGTGLLAATQQAAQPVTWLVTGVDDAGVERAAEAIGAGALRNAFAVAATPTGLVKLPVGAH
ncbi:MAG: hypothetical protein QOC77_2661 [Thermoleophilaceae bacterium]|jgi:hypothetical protein|nr:hypothetical protein [Thermoleophilaceae bacterium]